jgi:mono/diheme cytochrome c family protein
LNRAADVRDDAATSSLKPVVLAAVLAAVAGAGCNNDTASRSDPLNAEQVARGIKIYEERCATCHGGNLEGQPVWRTRLPSGRMPAPPHDDSGHTWHHADDVLFGITKFGLTPPYAPARYASDMPAFRDTLSDQQIREVLAYIKSRWSPRAQQAQAQFTRDARTK